MEKLKCSTKKENPKQLLGLISEISKASELKMNIEKNQFYFYK